MKDELLKFMINSDIKNGLITYNLPTGFGKSYNSYLAMYENTKKSGKKRIFFITPQKKNRSTNDIRNIYLKNNDTSFNEEVFELKSNLDFIIENFKKVTDQLPEDIRDSKEFINLQNKLTIRERSHYKTDIDCEISEKYEPEFRYLVHQFLNKKFKKSSDRKKAILSNKEYQWVKILYPQVEIENYKIIFLTSRKLVSRLDIIYKDSFDLLSSNLLNDSIVFLDEFDSIKADITHKLIDQSIRYQKSLIEMYEILNSSWQNHQICNSYYNLMSKEQKDDYANIGMEIKEIYNDFVIQYNYKSSEESSDGKNFIFNSNLFISILNNNRSHIFIKTDHQDKINYINFTTKELYDEHDHNEDINIYSMLRRINTLINKAAILFYGIAEKLYQKNIENDTGMSLESALSSVYNEFRISKSMKNFMVNLKKPAYRYNSNIFFYDQSFYARGFQYYEFADSFSHQSYTRFNYYDYQLTAEKILIYLSKRNKVIGLSATAHINSVISNFDLDYIKRVLGKDYYSPSDEFICKVKSELKETNNIYDQKIKIHIDSINITTPNIIKELADLFNDRQFAFEFYQQNFLRLDNYYQNRYLKIFMVINNFIDHDDIQSFLCVNSWLLNDRENSSKTVVETVFNKLKGDREIYLEVLDGSDYEKKKKDILKKLKNGKKVFVITSYQTIGKGQNLTYEIKNLQEEFVILSNKIPNRTKYKDFDGIYLGDITNVIPNITNKITIEQLYEYLIIVWSMYERNEIEYMIAKDETRKAFRAYSNTKNNKSCLRGKLSYLNYRTHILIQTLGRLNRTDVKKSNIYIYLDDELLKDVGLNAYDEDLSTPEVKKVFNYMKQYLSKQKDSSKMSLILENEKVSLQARVLINSYLNKPWTKETVKSWKQLRLKSLMYPSADNNQLIAPINEKNINYYIKYDKPFNKYFYYQNNDFSEIYISFNDKNEIISRLKCDDIPYIVEVSESNCGLDILMKNQEIKQFFKQNGFATKFEKSDYMLCPVMYNNIYKGALGEVVGKYILEKYLTLKLEELFVDEFYEYFDYKIDDIYIDFKHWRKTMKLSDEEYCQNVRKKLKAIGGKKAIIINLISQGNEYEIIDHNDVIEIPALVNRDGSFNEKNIKKILEVISICKF
ncbi:MAG: hypothetical protein ACLRT4_02835 [Thomasclavelia sp.]